MYCKALEQGAYDGIHSGNHCVSFGFFVWGYFYKKKYFQEIDRLEDGKSIS